VRAVALSTGPAPRALARNLQRRGHRASTWRGMRPRRACLARPGDSQRAGVVFFKAGSDVCRLEATVRVSAANPREAGNGAGKTQIGAPES
jgi:hypothetical protein